MVVKKETLKMIDDDSESFEFDILPKLAEINELYHFKHKGF